MGSTILGKITIITTCTVKLAVLENCGVNPYKIIYLNIPKSIRSVLCGYCNSGCTHTVGLLCSAVASPRHSEGTWRIKLNSVLATPRFDSLWNCCNSPLVSDGSCQQQPGVNAAATRVPVPWVPWWLRCSAVSLHAVCFTLPFGQN